jgi:hypothetical protein
MRPTKCFYCGVETTLERSRKGIPTPETRRTNDHWIPQSKGGDGLHNNTVTACVRCNVEKGNLTGPEYLAVLRFRERQKLFEQIRTQIILRRMYDHTANQ